MDRRRNLKGRWKGEGNLRDYLQRKKGLMNPRRDNPRAARQRRALERIGEGAKISKLP